MSHSWRDKPFVRKLDQSLRFHGLASFLDERDIDVGESIPRRVAEAIERSSHLVYVISAHSLESAWVQEELDIAKVQAKEKAGYRILPLLIEDVRLPASVRYLKYADFRNWEVLDRFYEALGQLLRALGHRLYRPTESELQHLLSIRNEVDRAADAANLAARLAWLSLDIGYSTLTQSSEARVYAILNSLRLCWRELGQIDYALRIADLMRGLSAFTSEPMSERLASLSRDCAIVGELFRSGAASAGDRDVDQATVNKLEHDVYRPFVDANRRIFQTLYSLRVELRELLIAGVQGDVAGSQETV